MDELGIFDLVELATVLDELDQFDNPSDVIYYFEKLRKWEDAYFLCKKLGCPVGDLKIFALELSQLGILS